jgi:bis(5'-nucleosidyl)-tetraphosphatase
MRSIVVQKAIVKNLNGEILILRRSKSDVRRPLQWDLPGGFREPKEELLTSINREVLEETGLSVQDLLPVFATTEVRSWQDGDVKHTDNVTFIFYSAISRNKEVMLSYEHDKYQWLHIDEAMSMIEYSLHAKTLKHIRDNKLLS